MMMMMMMMMHDDDTIATVDNRFEVYLYLTLNLNRCNEKSEEPELNIIS